VEGAGDNGEKWGEESKVQSVINKNIQKIYKNLEYTYCKIQNT